MTLPIVMSYSKLKTSECPFLYNQVYNLKNKPPKTEPLEFGIAVHYIFEDIARSIVKGEGINADEVIDRYVPPNLYHRIGEFVEIVDKFMGKSIIDISQCVGIEERIAVDKNGNEVDYWDKSAIFRGVLDLVNILDDTGLVIDHKSNINIDSFTILKQDQQLTAYTWLLKAKYPFLTRLLASKYFARYGVLSKPVEKNQVDLDNFRRVILKRIDEIKGWEEFEPKVCSECKWCHLRDNICPIGQEIDDVEIIAINSEDDLNEAIDKYHIYKKSASAFADAIKGYMSNRDIRMAGDKIKYGWIESEKVEYPFEATVNLAKECGLDIGSTLKINKTDLEKKLKSIPLDPKVRAAFEEIKDVTVSQRFQQIID